MQYGFLFITLWIGAEFALFVHQLERGTGPSVICPPGVEVFLLIRALSHTPHFDGPLQQHNRGRVPHDERD